MDKKNSKNKLKSEVGATIAEAMIASVLFAIVIIIVMQLFATTISSSARGLHAAKALIIAESYLESSNATFSAWNTIYTQVKDGVPYEILLKDLPHLSSIGNTKYEVKITYTMQDADMSKEHISKNVEVSWIGMDNEKKKLELASILTRD